MWSRTSTSRTGRNTFLLCMSPIYAVLLHSPSWLMQHHSLTDFSMAAPCWWQELQIAEKQGMVVAILENKMPKDLVNSRANQEALQCKCLLLSFRLPRHLFQTHPSAVSTLPAVRHLLAEQVDKEPGCPHTWSFLFRKPWVTWIPGHLRQPAVLFLL